MITTQRDARAAFWAANPDLSKRRIRDYSGTGLMYPTDTRVAWVDWLDWMTSTGQMPPALANRATLEG